MRSQHQVLQTRYEEVMAELDQAQAGHLKTINKQNRYQLENIEKQMDALRNENLDLKQTIREINKEKLVLSNAQMIQSNQMQQWQNNQAEYYNEVDIEHDDQLIEHF